jgi:ubiquinone biosynthesis accessory factor UbiJ
MDRLLARLLNRLLADQPGAAERLAAHRGKRLRLSLPMVRFDLEIQGDGRLAPGARTAAPDCEIGLPPHALAQLPLAGLDALSAARVTGDGVLASDLSALLGRFDWVLVLSPWLGPVLATRATQAAETVWGAQARVREAYARALAEYLVHEAGLLAEGQAVREFVARVDELKEAAERLEARLALLEQEGTESAPDRV